MEQTKAQFFAMYYGQHVQYNTKRLDGHFLCKPDYATKEWYLELRNIKQLTDNELINLAKIAGLSSPEIDRNDKDSILIIEGDYSIGIYYDGTVVMYKYKKLHMTPFWNYIYAIYQYLISIGICLSDEAVAKGWVILTNPQ